MVVLNNVSKIFDQRGIAGIRNINLEIPEGSLVALMGPNGSGKTTLLNLIAGLLPLDSGTITTSGKVHFCRLAGTSKELNVQKFLVSCIQTEMEDEKKIQLTRDFADMFEFTFQLKQQLSDLSQGQLQKVLLCGELINYPEIIILDEPFSHLDPMSRKEILKSLFKFLRLRQTSLVWVTHEKDEALRFADKIGLLQHGQIEQLSSPAQILLKPRNLFVAQFFGYQNFINISARDGYWQTPWGAKKNHLDFTEGYLVVPLHAWREEAESSFRATVLDIYAQLNQCLVELEFSNRLYQALLPLDKINQLKPGQKIALTADLDQCLVIPI
jgi:ABC-type sugar transport system ATPase subunit